ncbi:MULTISPECIES: helix-turn-helix transcriptional regulator [unclassified Pseudomonas]|uniref:helix-turn-helix transcriptional regulator n=1 Tax=unclassified Pseudomonas TaxID=196821 RepID=UPI000BC53444|nr:MULTISPECIES: helix-turn-helix transcriptional regulator [unclassified Pseudomonas]PVZ20688.1 regulatory LuxR family protein [Pseudomonas sp. URIL14HWK12:I12]PVZ27754.1 regulatory LuxR family protein [Pseudomonas sp. URIL14HWK12:I10]PVZ38643.1 regulatory LuxR family protein [Pseudomonas sp. URIL14HWK12:I11]SNZ02540.1 Response regulator containing a CheY-like receiver domain and an HTH DNA-binding domain [Pseudomonas sp. URIL14HWK12:I9]
MDSQGVYVMAKLITAIGHPTLGQKLCDLLLGRVSFDMSCLYLFRFDQPAELLHDGYNGLVSARTLESYRQGGYLLDPFYVASTHRHPGGLWRMSELAPDSFFSSGFAISPDLHPCVSSTHGSKIDEIGFIVHLQARAALVFTLMKAHRHGAFSDDEVAYLRHVAPVVRAALEQHGRHLPYALDNSEVDSRLEGAFVGALGQLTDAQRHIARLLLQGHSNASIARQLAISEGTVKVHKHNIYQRLEITSHAELFRLFIGYLAQTAR